jgi:hypothetical protein
MLKYEPDDKGSFVVAGENVTVSFDVDACIHSPTMAVVGVEEQIRKALKADPRPSNVIGDAAKIHPVSVRQFKNGSKGLSVESLESLARALGLKIVVKK